MKLSNFISYTLHPVIIPTIATILYFIIIPSYINSFTKNMMIGFVFIITYILPILLLIFLKKFNFISSIRLEKINERKIPLVTLLIITYQVGNIIKEIDALYYLALIFYGMGISILIAYVLLLMKIKVSLHLIGIGGLIGSYMMISYIFRINLLNILILMFICAGLIGSSRLKLKAHKPIELLIGLTIGILSEVVILYYNM